MIENKVTNNNTDNISNVKKAIMSYKNETVSIINNIMQSDIKRDKEIMNIVADMISKPFERSNNDHERIDQAIAAGDLSKIRSCVWLSVNVTDSLKYIEKNYKKVTYMKNMMMEIYMLINPIQLMMII